MYDNVVTCDWMLSGSRVLLSAILAALYGSHASHRLTVIPMYIEITCSVQYCNMYCVVWIVECIAMLHIV